MLTIPFVILTVGYIIPFKTRNDLGDLYESRGYKHGVELGVQKGRYAEHILKHWPSCESYLLVDLWQHQENYLDYANINNIEQEKNYQFTLNRLKPWKSKLQVCRNFTTVCGKDIKDGTLDVVYVDARHDYYGVFEDLKTWWPKLKYGGIMAGHDYMDAKEVQRISKQDWSLSSDGRVHSGAVRGAVNDFAKNIGRQVVLSYRESVYNSWAIEK